MKAKDVMHRRVLTAAPDTSLEEAARMLERRHISGMPVVSREGNLLGMISRTDLLGHASTGEPGTTVADAMTPWVVS